MTTTATTYDTIYECPDCGEQTTDRRCPDCHLFTRRLGPGGHCPHCDEIVLLDDLTTTHPARSTTETYTEDLTGSSATDPTSYLSDTPTPPVTPRPAATN